MILVDANVLVAAAIENDTHHVAAAALLESLPVGQLVVPTVLAEAAYLVNRLGGVRVELALLRSFVDGDLTLVGLQDVDMERVLELVENYASMDLGTSDASIVAVAERLAIDTVATFDRRHFAVVRPRHVPVFALLP